MKLVLFVLLSLACLYGRDLPLYFEGNTHVSSKDLYEALGLETPAFYEFYKNDPSVDPKTIALLVQTTKNYYKTKGYFNASTTSTQSADAITISVVENEPIRIATLSVISKLDIAAQIPFEIGKIFDATQFTQSKKDIKLAYSNQSYCNVAIDAKAWIDIQTNLAYLHYEITPNNLCHIGTISITPAPHIDTDIIESLLFFKPKELFTTQSISQTYKNLYAYEGIAKALINTQIDSNNTVNIALSVSENEKPIRLETGLGANSDRGLAASLRLKHRNFLGNLKTLSFDGQLSSLKQSAKVTFDMPLVHQNALGAQLGVENESFDGFKERRIYPSFYLSQRALPHVFKESIITDIVETYESTDVARFSEGNILISSLKLEWNYDTRDNVLDPAKGYFLTASISGAFEGALSDASYYKTQITGGYILGFGDSKVAIKSGFSTLHVASGTIPASYRLYAGGMNSNRAYAYNQLGPSDASGNPLGFYSLFETTLEYRFPLYGDFAGVVFSDNTFIGEDTLALNESYHTLGLGVRYATPIGPLAIDFGFDIKEPSKNYGIHFRIGELF